MAVKLLTEHHLELLSLKGGSQAHLNLFISKCHIVVISHTTKLKYLTLAFDSKVIPAIQMLTCLLHTLGKLCVKYEYPPSKMKEELFVGGSVLVFVLVCITLCNVLSSSAIILTRKRELVVLFLLSFGCLVTVNVL